MSPLSPCSPWLRDHRKAVSGLRRRDKLPGEIDRTIKVDDEGNGGGNSRNSERKEESKYVEMGSTEEETPIGRDDNAHVWQSHVVSQLIRQEA